MVVHACRFSVAAVILSSTAGGAAAQGSGPSIEGRLTVEPRFMVYVDDHEPCDRAALEALGITQPDARDDVLQHTTAESVWYCLSAICTLQITLPAETAPDADFAQQTQAGCVIRTTEGMTREDATSYTGEIEVAWETLRDAGVEIAPDTRAVDLFGEDSQHGDFLYTSRAGEDGAAVYGLGLVYRRAVERDVIRVRGVAITVTYGEPVIRAE